VLQLAAALALLKARRMTGLSRHSFALVLMLGIVCCAKDHGDSPRDSGPSRSPDAGEERDASDLGEVSTDRWEEVPTDCGYSFEAPRDLVKYLVQGIDSCVVKFDSAACTYTGDYGNASNSLEGNGAEPGEYESIEIFGVPAMLVTYTDQVDGRWRTSVHLPRGEYTKPTLTMDATCVSKEALSIAQAVFRTIRLTH
jgi:hypothetical protein